MITSSGRSPTFVRMWCSTWAPMRVSSSGGYGPGGYSGRVISFEPQSEPFAALRTRADLDPEWECHQLAVGDAAATLANARVRVLAKQFAFSRSDASTSI